MSIVLIPPDICFSLSSLFFLMRSQHAQSWYPSLTSAVFLVCTINIGVHPVSVLRIISTTTLQAHNCLQYIMACLLLYLLCVGSSIHTAKRPSVLSVSLVLPFVFVHLNSAAMWIAFLSYIAIFMLTPLLMSLTVCIVSSCCSSALVIFLLMLTPTLSKSFGQELNGICFLSFLALVNS